MRMFVSCRRAPPDCSDINLVNYQRRKSSLSKIPLESNKISQNMQEKNAKENMNAFVVSPFLVRTVSWTIRKQMWYPTGCHGWRCHGNSGTHHRIASIERSTTGTFAEFITGFVYFAVTSFNCTKGTGVSLVSNQKQNFTKRLLNTSQTKLCSCHYLAGGITD